MLIHHDTYGEIEVKLGDLFEFKSAVLSVCSIQEPRGICCRIESGAFREEVEAEDGTRQEKTLAQGDLIYFKPVLVAELCLVFNGPDGSVHQLKRKGRSVSKSSSSPVGTSSKVPKKENPKPLADAGQGSLF